MVRSEADRNIIDGFERDIKTLARTTAFVTKNHLMTDEEVYEFLNEKGEEYRKKYEPMSVIELILDLASELPTIKELQNVSDK